LKSVLVDNEKSLGISLIILEMPNSESIAKWLNKKMNVNEVIYFKVENKRPHDKQTEE